MLCCFFLRCTFKDFGFRAFLHGDFLLVPATRKAMAIDWRSLLPVDLNSEIFAPIFLIPFLSGISITHTS